MKNFGAIVKSYARTLALSAAGIAVGIIQTTGHLPATAGQWGAMGSSVLIGVVGVVLRWIDPNDHAFGVGATTTTTPTVPDVKP